MATKSQVFEFTDETGKPHYIGPVFQADELEKILVDKLNNCLVPVINSLVYRVEELTSEVNSLRNVIESIATPEGGTFKDVMLELKASMQPLHTNVESVLDVVRQKQQLSTENASLVSSNILTPVSHQSREPYVTVTIGETELPYFLTTGVWRQIAGSSIPRTIARVVLESLHTIKEMREFTLSGKGLIKRFKENETPDSEFQVELNPRKAIPPESVEIALAVVAKAMDKSILSQYENKTNKNG
ncbi:unnamed protein product, partial [Allacma fusca]